jgi:hypothetical protein
MCHVNIGGIRHHTHINGPDQHGHGQPGASTSSAVISSTFARSQTLLEIHTHNLRRKATDRLRERQTLRTQPSLEWDGDWQIGAVSTIPVSSPRRTPHKSRRIDLHPSKSGTVSISDSPHKLLFSKVPPRAMCLDLLISRRWGLGGFEAALS